MCNPTTVIRLGGSNNTSGRYFSSRFQLHRPGQVPVVYGIIDTMLIATALTHQPLKQVKARTGPRTNKGSTKTKHNIV